MKLRVRAHELHVPLLQRLVRCEEVLVELLEPWICRRVGHFKVDPKNNEGAAGGEVTQLTKKT